jgi:hypothetical protein
MDLDIESKKRNVIPRLRDFQTTLALGELSSGVTPTTNQRQQGALDKQIADWNEHKTLAFATDLVGAALTLGIKEDIKEAVDFILSEESNSTALQRRVALQAFDSEFAPRVNPEVNPNTTGRDVIDRSRERVKKLRSILYKNLRNPIRLVELALEYAVLGNQRRAKRTMISAVALAPSNRYVLRSAARLFVHLGEAERAHYVLRRAPSLHSDPWLLSAEIATSSLLGRTSSLVKAGISQLEGHTFNDFHTSELASAIATLEMENANSKQARKLFRRALRNPTENSIAQAEWASRVLGNLPIEEADAPLNYEALAWHYQMQHNWEDALTQGKGWVLDQPFAAGPVLFAGRMAGLLEQYELFEALCRFGLRANPTHKMLRNNLAFALASNDAADAAERELSKIDRGSLDDEHKIVLTATEGLIHFRKRDLHTGRALYRRAIELAKESNWPSYVARAYVYLAREEIRANTLDARKAILVAEYAVKQIEATGELTAFLRRLKKNIEGDPQSVEMANDLVDDMKSIIENSREQLND